MNDDFETVRESIYGPGSKRGLAALDRIEAEVERLTDLLGKAEAEAVRYEGEKVEAEAEVERLRKDENALRRELHTAYEERKLAEAEVERLRNENMHLVSRFRAALDERDRLRANLESTQEELRLQDIEQERLRAIIDGSAPTSPIGVQRAILKENERLRAARIAFQQEYPTRHELEREVESLRAANDILRNDIREMSQREERLRAALERIDQYGNRMSPESKMARAALAKEVA